MRITPYDQKTGRALCERAREAGCGYAQNPDCLAHPLTLRETLEWARRIPRAARVAQGFTRIADFVRKVKQLRIERAELRKPSPDPVRRAILDTLDRILAHRTDLVIVARRETRFWWRPRMKVWWGCGKPRAYDSARVVGGRYYPKRDVAVPAAWLLARIDKDVPNVAVRVRQADAGAHKSRLPESRMAGAFASPPIRPIAGERDRVKTCAAAIPPFQEGRRIGLPHTFGWQKVWGPCGDGREVWETPAGEQYWLDRGAKLERVRNLEARDEYLYTVLEPLQSRGPSG